MENKTNIKTVTMTIDDLKPFKFELTEEDLENTHNFIQELCAKEVERQCQEEYEKFEKDPYAYYGVSEKDFIEE